MQMTAMPKLPSKNFKVVIIKMPKEVRPNTLGMNLKKKKKKGKKVSIKKQKSYVVLFTIVKLWKQPKYPLVDE